MWLLSLFLMFLLLILSLSVLWYIKRRPLAPARYLSKPPKKGQYTFESFKDSPPFNRHPPTFFNQSQDWQREFQSNCLTLSQHKVTHIIFVHGTFVGDDPLDLSNLLNSLSPGRTSQLASTIRDYISKHKNLLVKDLGHFSDEYIQLFRDGSGSKIEMHNFLWSSANHHLARVQGAIKLIHFLHALKITSDDRILLIGHSHAGQLFSLLSIFMNSAHHAQNLLKIVDVNYDQVKNSLLRLKNMNLDFVTYGCPPRYPWIMSSNIRLLNIINHRGNSYEGGSLTGLLTTRDGDYVQQWALAGSDSYSPVPGDQKIIKSLEKLLGSGSNIREWGANIKYKKRVPNFGFTCLVDYHDHALLPNCHKTIFGHGTYTKYEMILLNLNLITKYLYREISYLLPSEYGR